MRSLQSETDKGRVFDILENGRLYCAEWYKLNDPFEGRFRSISVFPEYSRRFVSRGDLEDLYPPEDGVWRVCSLSATIESTLLWSHYAAGGTGIAIGVDFSDRMETVTRVDYSDDLPTFESNTATHLLGVKQLLARKTTHWNYETEYRIITSDTFVDVTGKIRRVVVGPRCSRGDEALVRQRLPAGASLRKACLNHEQNRIDA